MTNTCTSVFAASKVTTAQTVSNSRPEKCIAGTVSGDVLCNIWGYSLGFPENGASHRRKELYSQLSHMLFTDVYRK